MSTKTTSNKLNYTVKAFFGAVRVIGVIICAFRLGSEILTLLSIKDSPAFPGMLYVIGFFICLAAAFWPRLLGKPLHVKLKKVFGVAKAEMAEA